jgi:hypothetical protein
MTYRASATTTTWPTLVILDTRGKTVRADRGKIDQKQPFHAPPRCYLSHQESAKNQFHGMAA